MSFPLETLDTKFHRLDLAAPPSDPFVLEGYAAVFGEADSGGDVIAPGAFSASLARRQGGAPGVKLLWQHDPARPIGVWESLHEDARGLRVRGRLLPEVRVAEEAAALLRAGALDGLSIGYRAVRAEKAAGGLRRLVEIDLWEISLVTFPMASGARVDPAGGAQETETALAIAEAASAFRLN